MRWFERLFHEFIEVVEWRDDDNDTMVFRFERYGASIRHRAKLVVRESQVAVFVHAGRVADALGPGSWVLDATSLPVLAELQHWHRASHDTFKADVWFLSTRRFTDLRWSMRRPILAHDAGFERSPIRVAGRFALRIDKPTAVVREIVDPDGVFQSDEITGQLRELIETRVAGIVRATETELRDRATRSDGLDEFLARRIAPELREYGLKLTALRVVATSLRGSVADSSDRTDPGDLAYDSTGPPPVDDTPTAPPMPSTPRFHVVLDGTAAGPFGLEELARHIAHGRLVGATLVWRDGMDDWRPAVEVALVAALLPTCSPPVAPPS